MRSLFSVASKPSRRRGVRRREVFSAQFDRGQSAAAHDTRMHLGCDVLERRFVLTSSESDFIFSQGTITGYTGIGGEIEIPSMIGGEAVVSIGESAFANRPTITRVVIPDGLTIGDYAFSFNTSLKRLDTRFNLWGISCVSIGRSAFEHTGLSDVWISSVKTIGAYAFANNASLENVRVTGEGTTSIGDYAFVNNASMKSVWLSGGITNIGRSAFEQTGLETATIEGVTTIGGYAFANNTALKSLLIGDGVSTIGNHAFRYAGFKSLTIPSSVETIGDHAFAHNYALKSVTIGDGVTSIGDYAFQSTGLKNVTIPGTVDTIGVGAFAVTSLTGVTIGDGVMTIGDSAFAGNPGLRNVTVPGSVDSIGDFAFAGNTALRGVTIGNGVTTIGNRAFQNTGLKSVTIPGSVDSVGDYAFGGNTALRGVTIGNGVISIGDGAFFNISARSVTIPDSVTRIGSFAFANNAALQAMMIGDGVTSIGDYAFQSTRLTNVMIPDSVTSIGSYAFANNTALQTVIFGGGVTSIGDFVFSMDVGLRSVTFTANAPSFGSNPFEGVLFGAKAIRDAALSGYGQNGDLWNGLIVWKPGAVAAPTVTVKTATLARTASVVTIAGNGFVAGKPAAHRVVFNKGAVGTVTAATATMLTVRFDTKPTSTGHLTAIVTSVGGSSGVARRVATVVAAPAVKVPFPKLPAGAGKLAPYAPKFFASTPSGLQYRILRQGSGAKPNATATVTVNYQGWLDGGKVFDSSYPKNSSLIFRLDQVIAGFAEGVQLVGKGGMIELVMPSNLAYGSTGSGSAIPPNSTTYWLVEIIDVR